MISELRRILPTIKNGMKSKEIHDARGVITNTIDTMTDCQQRVVVVAKGGIHLTEDMCEAEAVQVMTNILAGIADDTNSQDIVGVYRITVHESVTRE